MQRHAIDLTASRAAQRDYRRAAQRLDKVAAEQAAKLPLSSRVVRHYSEIALHAARAEWADSEPIPFELSLCGCDECLAYMWRTEP